MIEYIKGDITELTPALMILECGGIGYALNISLNTFTAFNGKPNGKLYVYEVIREDAHLLYGFAEKIERELFLLLTSVSGVGPNTARILSVAAAVQGSSPYPTAWLSLALAIASITKG